MQDAGWRMQDARCKKMWNGARLSSCKPTPAFHTHLSLKLELQ
jgi:hypothetical protein